MTLLEDCTETRANAVFPSSRPNGSMLRAPRHEDVKAIAIALNDRRIAENTTRIPHPYRLADAEEFVAIVNRETARPRSGLLRDGTLIGGCGIDPRDEGDRRSATGSAAVTGVTATPPRRRAR